MSSTIDKIVLDAKKPGVQLEHALLNYYKSIESKNPDFVYPRIKVVSSTKLEKTAGEDAKKLLELKALYDEAKKLGNKIDADRYKSEFKALKAKKTKASSDIINLNDIEFVKIFDKEFVETRKNETPSSHISDPELRGLIDILGQKQNGKKEQKAEAQKVQIKKILKALGLEVHNSHLSTSNKRFTEMLGNMDWFRVKVFNCLFKPFLSKNGITKRYLITVCEKFDEVLEQVIDGIQKENIIEKISKNKFALEHYTEEKPDLNKFSKEEKEELKKEMAMLKSIDTKIDELNQHEISDLKEHLPEYKEVINKVGKVAGVEYDNNDALTFIKNIVKVAIELNNIKTFNRIDKYGKTKESKLGDIFVKDLFTEIPVKIPINLRKIILTTIEKSEELKITNEDVAIFENYEGGITDLKTFENLANVSDLDLKNYKSVRQAIGIRLFVEVLKKIDKMVIAHGGKYGFNVTIYY